jgi:hypothetical protein
MPRRAFLRVSAADLSKTVEVGFNAKLKEIAKVPNREEGKG